LLDVVQNLFPSYEYIKWVYQSFKRIFSFELKFNGVVCIYIERERVEKGWRGYGWDMMDREWMMRIWWCW